MTGAAAAAALATPETIQKPDFTATDGVCTTFFYSYQDGCTRFFGTSAAAPHAAAVATLLVQKANQLGKPLSQALAKWILQTSAQSMSGGELDWTGAGMVDATAAQALLNGSWVYLPFIID